MNLFSDAELKEIYVRAVCSCLTGTGKALGLARDERERTDPGAASLIESVEEASTELARNLVATMSEYTSIRDIGGQRPDEGASK